MTEGAGRPVVVLSRWWKAGDELSFVVRTVAGAASRRGPVTVLVPDDDPGPIADGAFDLFGIGRGALGGWPPVAAMHLPSNIPEAAALVVDEVTDDLVALLAGLPASGPVFCIADAAGGALPSTTLAAVGGGGDGTTEFVGLHVPVNPLAAAHRHNGFGFVDYLLVLSDRSGRFQQPPEAAAWLTAGFHDANVVVVEDACASVWRGRALRGSTTVDSRTDLWRLIAHARACVDLAPGPIVARECVESLRFGTPIMVPAHSAAAAHAASGGGLTFASMAELLDGAGRCGDEATRSRMALAGREYADGAYGDPSLFRRRVDRVLSGEGRQSPS